MDVAIVRGMRNVHVKSAASAAILAELVTTRQIGAVAVEGFPGVGKSKFAAEIATLLRWRHIDVDPFLVRSSSTEFADHVDRAGLHEAIGSGHEVVLSGVCLRDVVDIDHVDPLRVYVARVSLDGSRYIWHDGADMQENEETAAEDSPHWLSQRVSGYHRRVRPHVDADYTFLRVEDRAST